MAPPRAPHCRAWLVGAIAAGFAAHVPAARLDAFASGAIASGKLAGAATDAAVISMLQPTNTARDRDLSMAADFVAAVTVMDVMTLSDIQDILYHFGRLRATTLSVRDRRSGQVVRSILRDIRTKSEALNRLAARKKAEGEVDDGGDVRPSQRDNICNSIDEHNVGVAFSEDVRSLCKALDVVRAAVSGGEGEDASILRVSGHLSKIRSSKEYPLPEVALGIESLMGEEHRWVLKQFAQRPEQDGPRQIETRPGGLMDWVPDVVACSHLDPALRERRLQDAYAFTLSIVPDAHNNIRSLRSSLQGIQLCKEMVAEFITCSDATFRERIRELLRLMKEKSEALHTQIELRLSAGETEDTHDLPPSQRDTVCGHLDDYGFAPDLRQEMKQICESLDRMREVALSDGDTDAALTEAGGRVNVLKSRPGYSELPIAGQFEILFAEEYFWLSQYLHREHA